MAKGHIERGWEGYRLVVLPASASAVQVSETKKGFYAGAWCLLGVLMNQLEPGAGVTEADLAMMDDIQAELMAFGESGGDG